MNEFIQTWWPVVTTLGTVLAIAIAYWVKTTVGREFSSAIQDVSKTVEEHSERITALEVNQKLIPSKEDLHELSLKVERLGGNTRVISERMEGLSDEIKGMRLAVDRVQDFLLNKGH